MDYAVTMTLKPSYYELKVQDQYNMLQNIILERYKNYKKSLFVEFTENHNLHVHGIIYSSTKRGIYDARKRSCIGYIKVKPIQNYQDWVFYCVKNTITTYQELPGGYCPALVNDYKIEYKSKFDQDETMDDWRPEDATHKINK